MKKIKVFVLALLVLGACKNFDFGDINKDPIGPNETSPKDMLAGGIINFFNNTGRTYFTNPTFYLQWLHQNYYTSEMQYADYPVSWGPWYSGIVSNFEENMDYIDAHRNENFIKALGDPNNQIAINKIMAAYMYKFITDVYGDVPMSEAANKDILYPKYDSQLEIYRQVIADLKEARDMLDPNAGELLKGVKGDPIYGPPSEDDPTVGQIQILRWQKLANSLILHAALQLSDVDPQFAEDEFRDALQHPAGVLEEVEDDAWVKYNVSSRAYRNPFARLRKEDYYLTKELTDALQGEPRSDLASNSPIYNHTQDYREYIISDSPGNDGAPYDYLESLGTEAQISGYLWNAEAPLPFFTSAWTYLDRAEAVARGWNTGDNYDDMLYNAIVNSYRALSERYGVDITPFADAFANARVADANDPAYGNGAYTNIKLAVVAEEKWISYFPMGFEGWAQWRRLDLPALIPISQPLNGGNIPTRYSYPSNEQTYNREHYLQGVQNLNPPEDRNESKVPWDVN